MRLSTIAGLLECDVLLGEERLDTIEVRACFAADLMSDVLRFSHAGTMMITGLTSVQSVHTADVADLAAVLFVGDKRPNGAVLDLAREKGIPLLTTRHNMFDACGILYAAHLAPASGT
jgi:predicted transcriptional regulator